MCAQLAQTLTIESPPAARKPWYRILYVQVLIAVALGVALGHFAPRRAVAMQPLGDGFIKLVKMIIAPIIFCTLVHGIASMADLKKLGRVGLKTAIYFEVVSTLALAIGLVVVNVMKPGVGAVPPPVDPAVVSRYVEQSKQLTTVDFFMNMIPSSYLGGLAGGELLQVILLSLLTAFALLGLGPARVQVLHGLEVASRVFFGIMAIIIRLAPIGAFGAMAYTVGKQGVAVLGKLAFLMACFYGTAVIFVVLVLGVIAWYCGFSIFRFVGYIKDELLLVLGTSSSEAALPGMLSKMRRLGCSESTVGLVIPAGYSFNLDGTNIYMTMAAVFLAQATGTHLGIGDQLALLAVAMISSKGASGVTGAGFITLAATLAAVPSIPIASLGMLLGIDRFMSECRALTNLVGNGVATVVMSRWEGEVSAEELRGRMVPTVEEQLNLESAAADDLSTSLP